MLKDDGVMLRHSIGRSDGPRLHQSLDRQIHLPGGCLPALPKVAERSYDAWFVVPCWMSG
ncbi:hypothetical protein KQX62_15445 [Rhodopseudomonas palustris]|uniref:Uncharacterized protein n=1 Tax=Rhodopseudomonas palustris TaxID=1076 RepID=A0AAX3DTH1_RHOPL|nr:hypothetical protein KQX62_15445 [Rhodopseudomonas palustris]